MKRRYGQSRHGEHGIYVERSFVFYKKRMNTVQSCSIACISPLFDVTMTIRIGENARDTGVAQRDGFGDSDRGSSLKRVTSFIFSRRAPIFRMHVSVCIRVFPLSLRQYANRHLCDIDGCLQGSIVVSRLFFSSF